MSLTWEEQGVGTEELGDLFDFHGATEEQPSSLPLSHETNDDCQSQAGSSGTCHSIIDRLDDKIADPTPAKEPEYGPEDYAAFQDWIPRFVKPDRPCGYCQSRNLQCYLSYGKLTCTACDTLFRPCSFAQNAEQTDSGRDLASSNVGILDTLHTVSEDATQEQGALTGTRLLKSRAAMTNDDKKANPRFSRAAVKSLKEWVDQHQDNPYPCEDEKAELGRLTGLRYGQINTWFANARRRGKVGPAKFKGTASPSIRPSSPIGVPSSGIEVVSWENMNPLERWKHSPPTNEPAPIEQIRLALDKNDLPSLDAESPSTLGYTGVGSSRARSKNSNSNRRAPSMTSLEQLSSHSAVSSSAAWSGSHESFGSFSSFGSGLHGKRERRRRRKVPTSSMLRPTREDKTKRVFQCTFCTDSFKSKYDWSRHEKTLHLSLEKFICCPLGPEIVDPATGGKLCAYCKAPNPTPNHLELHGHQACVEKGFEARTFYRKDHLRQHLRLMHTSELLPHMDTWKVEAKSINSRCGFCAQRFSGWQDRVDHIAGHFKQGRKMVEWKGCRGLDPDVAANVLNAMPPYLIGIEQGSPDPFSATSIKNGSPMNKIEHSEGPPVTCWEILTVRLGRFAKEQSDAGVLLTDELLQHQARLILYDDPDPWNHTSADNPEWLDLFKRAHGLGFIPHAVGGIGGNVPEDLELYGDLGVRIPFSVQLERGMTTDIPEEIQAHMKEADKRRTQGLQDLASQSPNERGYTSYSSLPLPYEKAKQFETIAGPYSACGVPGQAQRTESMPNPELEVNFDSLTPEGMVALLAMDSTTSPSDPSASTPNTMMTDHNSGNDKANSNLCYDQSVNVFADLGMGSGKDAIYAPFESTTQQGQSQAQGDFLIQMGLHPQPTTQRQQSQSQTPCCTTGNCYMNCAIDPKFSTQEISQQVAAAASAAAVSADPTIAHFTADSFPNPVGIDANALAFSLNTSSEGGMQGVQGLPQNVDPNVFSTGSSAENLTLVGGGELEAGLRAGAGNGQEGDELQMEDVFMGGDTDLDFNDMSFANEENFGELNFGMYAAQMGLF